MTVMPSKCGREICARSSTKRASSICIRRRMAASLMGGPEEPVTDSDTEAMVFWHWADNDGRAGCIQFAQSREQAASQLFVILQIAPLVNPVRPSLGELGRQHYAYGFSRSLLVRGDAA